MCILGVRLPDILKGDTETGHELTVLYSLVKEGKENIRPAVSQEQFADFLREQETTSKNAGVIATFWKENSLFHSMIVGEDDKNWIGSNNVGAFILPGNRIHVDVSGKLRGNDKILLKPMGKLNACLYDIRYFDTRTVASFISNT